MAGRARCNVCGVPEDQWKDGQCTACGTVCSMTPDVIIEQRFFDYARKHELLDYGIFHIGMIYRRLCSRRYRLPKYFRDAIARDGRSFASLEEFPKDEVLIVCWDSADGTFQVGMLVWRGDKAPGGLDGINFVYEAACLDAEFCDEALKGAMFEDSYLSIENFTK